MGCVGGKRQPSPSLLPRSSSSPPPEEFIFRRFFCQTVSPVGEKKEQFVAEKPHSWSSISKSAAHINLPCWECATSLPIGFLSLRPSIHPSTHRSSTFYHLLLASIFLPVCDFSPSLLMLLCHLSQLPTSNTPRSFQSFFSI